MASIFLSYAREDAAKARTLAKALERAGHAVWWDRQIFGGSEFSSEIEAALKDAEVVIVLWSEAAIKSAWVRDEAAEGRDSGRLVPVMLEDCAPPLGFRQVQSISLAGWQGRGSPPHLQEILQAVAMRTGNKPAVSLGEPARPRMRSPLMLALAVLGALLLAIGGWWLLEGRGKASATPVLAVLPFADLSPDGDKAYFAEGVAEAILTVLAKEPGIQVVGRSTARQLHDAGNDAVKMRKALGVTHILEGTARSVGDQLRMSVRLIDAEDGQQLWAEEYRRKLDNVFAVQDEIGRAVAQRLKGSFSAGRQAGQQLTSTDAYTLYLAARAKTRERRLASLNEAMGMARKVIAADPNYAPGHALYAELIWQMSFENYGTLPMERVRELARPHALRAIQLAPDSADGHAALGVISRGDDAIRSLRKAIRLDPARAELRLWLARELERLGRNAEGLEHLKAAHEMDPLFGPPMWNYAWWLAASGRDQEAAEIVDNFERRGGSRATAALIHSQLRGMYQGDFSEGIRFAEMALRADPTMPIVHDTLAYFYQVIGLFDKAARYSGHLPGYTRLWASGDYRRLAAQARADGDQVWQKPDFTMAITALAVVRDWATIERLFESMPKREMCDGSGMFHLYMLVDLAAAMQQRQRNAEAATILGCIKQISARHGRGTVRTAMAPEGDLDLVGAQVAALENRASDAFRLLDRALANGKRTAYGRGLSEFPAFDRFQRSPEYARADARLKQLTAKERAEYLASLRRAA